MLRINAFGELMALQEQRRVGGSLRTPERHALLALLAVEGEVGVTFERVRSLLGAGTDSGEAVGSYWRGELMAVRETLGEHGVAVTDEVVYLEPGLASTDVADFRRAVADGDLERTAQLYRGRLVDGFHHRAAPEFERWLQTSRDAFDSDAAAALEQLADAATRRGEPLAAVRWWRLLAAQHPLNNRIAASLMEALVAAGDREGALRHARFHEALVAEQLDLPADAEVLAMARSLRAGAVTVRAAVGTNTDELVAAADASTAPNADPLERLRTELAGRYLVEREIARGGHGVVLLARDIRHRRLVALKVLQAELTTEASLSRFRREIRVVAALQHPNILPLFDSGTAAGLPYFVMPYVEGESLRDRLQRDGALPVPEAIALARQVASALAAAHARGVVHRDIKPENLLLSSGQPLVADFGVAAAHEGITGGGLTMPGFVLGTPAYMSPEQAAANRPVDERADQYALGCVLYEMLMGHPPFTGTSVWTLLASHANTPVPPLRTSRPDVPVALETVVVRALAKRPDDRFSSIQDFAAALVATEAGAVPWARAPSRTVRVRAAVAVLLVLLGAMVALVVSGPGERMSLMNAQTTEAGATSTVNPEP